VNYLVQSIELLREQLREIEAAWRRGEPGDAALFDDLRRILQIMTDGAHRTAAIVRKLRDFSRQDGPRVVRVSLDAVLNSSLELLHYEVRGRIRVERRYAPVDPIEGDPAQLGQVFLNLLNNAAQAIAGEGRIVVALMQDDERVLVSIEDTGPGIAPEHMARIFDPFFTTKEVGKGTGLGLSLSYRIVQRHGGDIRVDSPSGGGARFTVRLPRPGAREGREAAPEPEQPQAGASAAPDNLQSMG
jgi:signal transduction histidine kinase